MTARGIGDRFVCPQLPASPKAAIALAASLLKSSLLAAPVGADDTPSNRAAYVTSATIVGSSLGGYYATWLAAKYDLNAVLVNPAVASAISLEKYLGPQTWLYSGEQFELTRAHLGEMDALYLPTLSRPERFWLLAEEGDETLDFRQAVARYQGARQTVLPGGDHSFTRWDDYLDSVIEFAGLA